jgi:hypothetical protein
LTYNYNMSKTYQKWLWFYDVAINKLNNYREELETQMKVLMLNFKEQFLGLIEGQKGILNSTEYMIRAQQNEDEAQLTRSEKNNRLIAKKND